VPSHLGAPQKSKGYILKFSAGALCRHFVPPLLNLFPRRWPWLRAFKIW